MSDAELQMRHRSPYSLREKITRVLWSLVESTLFRWTWPTWYWYRGWLLRRFGAEVHPAARIRRTCRFTCPWNLTMGPNSATGERVNFYCLGKVTIGARVTLSHDVSICSGTHDYTDPMLMPLKRPPIVIHDEAWVASESFVGPDVEIGEGAILGARACTFKDLTPWTIYVGNPARPLKDRPKPTKTPPLDPRQA